MAEDDESAAKKDLRVLAQGSLYDRALAILKQVAATGRLDAAFADPEAGAIALVILESRAAKTGGETNDRFP